MWTGETIDQADFDGVVAYDEHNWDNQPREVRRVRCQLARIAFNGEANAECAIMRVPLNTGE